MGFFSSIKNAFSKVSAYTGSKPKMSYSVVEGIDVSHYQKAQDWLKHKAAGIEFVFVNCTDGLDPMDKMYFNHVNGAKNAKILTGSYHFFKPELDAVKQAEHFVHHCINTELGYVCDLETTGGLSSAEIVDRTLKFLRHVEYLTGQIPMIYGGPSKLNGLRLPTVFGRYPLWIANYKTSKPQIPAPWDNYRFWQWSENYKGVNLDRNYFRGTIEDLKGFTQSLVGRKLP